MKGGKQAAKTQTEALVTHFSLAPQSNSNSLQIEGPLLGGKCQNQLCERVDRKILFQHLQGMDGVRARHGGPTEAAVGSEQPTTNSS